MITTARAADNPLEECAAIVDSTDRLACYDRVAGVHKPDAERHPVGEIAPPAAYAAQPVAPITEEPTQMSRAWELEPGTRNDLFSLRPYQLTYFLPGRYSDSVNQKPFSGQFHGDEGQSSQLDHTEAKYQLSGKMKVADDLFWDDASLWVAYTQVSHWQVYNHAISAPFRETDYEPEAMVVFPTHFDLLGLNTRFLSLGVLHQSNGDSDPLSRSWNRVYAEAGFERGNFSLLARPWWRIPESRSTDDNPDISDYMGRGDIQAIYRFGNSSIVSLTVANNLRSQNRGSVQLDYVFPIIKKLSGYVQVFSGYGESLIDYNFRQNTIGIGLSLGDGI